MTVTINKEYFGKSKNYRKKKVQCMDCNRNYFEMVFRGYTDRYDFSCNKCSSYGIKVFYRKG